MTYIIKGGGLKSNIERKDESKVMCKSYTKPPMSQSCWLLLVLVWEEASSGLSARTNKLRHFASRVSCHSPDSQHSGDLSYAESWMRLQVLNHFDSPLLQWSHIENQHDWERLGTVYKRKVNFQQNPPWRRVIWFYHLTNTSAAWCETYLSSWVSFLRLKEGSFRKL